MDEIVIDETFERSETQVETYESMEELNIPQEYDSYDSTVIPSDELNLIGWSSSASDAKTF